MVRIQKISLLFVLLLVTTFVHAQTKIGKVYYKIIENTQTVKVCAGQEAYTGAIEIPGTIKFTENGSDYQVVAIEESAFKDATGLTSISIPASVTFIGKNAFENCTMKKVFFPSFNDIMKITFENNGNPMARAEETWAGEEKIGPELTIAQDVNDNAFNGVKWLTKVTFTSGVTSIGEFAFCNCTNLESIGFSGGGNNITIGMGAFQNCNKLLTIGENNDIPTIPSNVTTVGEDAFRQCKSLTEVVIDAHLVTLPNGMFRECINLKKVTLWEGTTKIGGSAFSGCTSLTSFPFQDNHIIIISESAFQSCGFKTLTLPTTLADPSPSEKAIGLNAFKDCNNLTDLTIPAGVSNFSIGNYAFSSNSSNNILKFIYSDADIVPSATTLSFDGNTPQLFCKESKLNNYKNETPWKDFNPMKIEKYSITYVKDNDMEHPVDVVSNVQAGTTLHLNSLQAEEGWTTPHGWFIKNEQGEFENAPEVMPASDLILYCYYTTTYADGDIKYSLRSDTKEATILADESNKSLTGSLTIPSAVTYKSNDYEIIAIEDEAFKDAVNLTGVDLSGATNLTNIGKGIFEGCLALTSVTLPNTLTEISDNMFYKCSALSGLTIPTSVTKIGEKAFSWSGIEEITLPVIITMGKNVFQECGSLKKVTFASETPLVTLPDYTFAGCIKLESFPTLPATITTIGQNAFSYCQGFTEIKLDNITTIKSSAFKNCEFLKVITLPTVFNIGDDAFNFCLSVEKITINTDNAPTVGNNPFYVKEGKINAILFVKDTINYQNAPWKLFKKVYPIDPTVIPSDEIEITLSPKSYTYDGNAKEPEVTVKWIIEEQDTLIIPAEEYTVSYSNNINAGTTATVTITDKAPGFYKIVEADTTFTINKADVVLGDLLEPKPAGKENLTYDDKALQLITAGRLKNNVTGTLEYSLDGKTFKEEIPTGTDANTYNVYYRVKGDDNHNDSKISDPLTVTIAPKELTSKELVITLSQDTYSYTGNEIKPGVTAVKYGDITFKEGVDYTVSYENNINAGTKETQPKVIITDKAGGNYVVSGSKAFTINKADVVLNDLLETAPSAIALTFNGTAKSFNGTAQPLIKAGVLKDPQTGTLEYSQDGKTFSEEIPTGTDANTYKVYYRVKGDGNHNDSKNSDPLEVAIAPKELTSEELEITLSPSSYTYDGSEKKPDVTVKFGDTEFIKDKDFTVSYKNHKYVGTAEAQPTVVITDKNGGNYIVSGSKTFTIKPAASSLKNKPTARNNTYDGTDLALLNTDGKSDTGKLQYSLSKDEESFSETIPTGKNAGNYIVYYRVKGDANHSDSGIESVTATIAPREANALSLSQSSYTYDGGEIKPSVTVQWNNTTVPGSEYTVSYSNNLNAGIATVIVTDKEGGNFTVNGSKTFTINKADVVLKDLLETAPTAIALTFNGTAKSFNGTAQPLIKAGVLKDPQTGTLEYSQDGKTFSEEIPTGTDANTYKVYYRVKGDGNHNDSKNSDPLEVVIAPKELTSEELEITLAPSSYTYDGSEKKPDVTVKFGDTEFTKDKDYTVSYSNCKNVGIEEAQPTVTIKDKNGGNYIVSGSKTFTIKPAASSLKNKPTARNNTYDGTDLALLNTDGKSDTGKLQYSLSKDEESFSETIPTGKNAGNYIVYYRVKGDANHSDSEIESVTATIAPREANALSLSQSSYTYDGGEIKPSVTVKWNNTTVSGSEYTVSYSNNKNAGIATVIVTDKEGGNFIVSARKTFTITQAPLTISADSYEIFEGEKIPDFTAKYNGFVKNETQAVLTSKPIFSCNATATSKPGDYTISVGGAKADNYIITHKSGKLTILALKFVSGGESSKDEDDPATYKIISTGKDVGTTPTVAIFDDKEVGGAFAIPEAVTYHNTNYKVTEINESAFENNKYLTEVSIPSSITGIGDKAFKGCSNLKSITVYITTPISLAVAGTRGEETSSDGTSVFDGVDKTTCILYVPEASVDLYKAAPVWMDFQNILPITETTGISVVNVTEGEPFDVYNLQGRKVKSRTTDLRGLPRGIYIINGKKVAVK